MKRIISSLIAVVLAVTGLMIVGCGTNKVMPLSASGDSAIGKGSYEGMTFDIPGGYKAIREDDIGSDVIIAVVDVRYTGATIPPTVLITIGHRDNTSDYKYGNTESKVVNGLECVLQRTTGSTQPLYIFPNTSIGTIFVDGRNTKSRENAEKVSEQIANSIKIGGKQ